MFGLRLKSWMEAHLGRPRHKSTNHQNQKQQRSSSKDSSNPSSSHNTTVPTVVTVVSTASSPISTLLNPLNSNNVHVGNGNLETSNLEQPHLSTPFCTEITTATTTPSSSTGQVQCCPASQGSRQDRKEPLEESMKEGPQKSCPRSSTTGSVNNSSGILLGCFTNNLSSPDTGYSTDGYSPKSVYPALSFESSGKSTPKSSYTISSLVSSELLHLSKQPSLSSGSCSVQNGLDGDECVSPLLPTHPEQTDSQGTDSSPEGPPSTILEQPVSHSINGEERSLNFTSLETPSSQQPRFRTSNDIVNAKQSITDPQVLSQASESSSSSKNMMVAHTPNLSSVNLPNDNGNRKSNDLLRGKISSPEGISPIPPDNCNPIRHQNQQQHRRTESMDERNSPGILNVEGNSSSGLTGPNRNIRTSFVLGSSQIPECNPGLKNAFSICSPRRERSRIKTNPWISIGQQSNDNGNSSPNTKDERVDGARISGKQTLPPAGMSESPSVEKASLQTNERNLLPRRLDNHSNHTGVTDTCTTGMEINKRRTELNKESIGVGGENLEDPYQPDSSGLVYRISTSRSASDSGKGSLDPETNRNSTESSCLLSDSTSTRNSIISQEAETGGGESQSGSSATDILDNHEHGLSIQVAEIKSAFKNTEQQSQSFQCSSGGNNPGSIPPLNIKPSVGIHKIKQSTNHYNPFIEPKSEPNLSTSITPPPELISSSAKRNLMVDKETDILSDWANTDEDGEDEIESDPNEGITPTPSSPDTDTGGRANFPYSRSASSATDIDFGDSSAATAASGVIPTSSSAIRHHFSQNINKHSNDVAVQSPYHHHNMNLPTTCYQPIQILPDSRIPDMYVKDHEDALWNQSQPLVNHVLIQPTGVSLASTRRCTSPGISNANISLSSLYSHPSESDYNANKSSSNALTRGALGFLRKIFKKGSCSTQRSSPGSDKVKTSRSVKGRDTCHNLPSTIGLRSPLLTADAFLSPHPLVNRKASLNGYFLTPTPNAFRRKSGTGTDSSDSKGSRSHTKPVKTDVIRLLPGTLSPIQTGHIMQTSSSSTSSSHHNGASIFQNTIGTGIHSGQSNTSSTTNSSVHSMSTSNSAASGGGGGPKAVSNKKSTYKSQPRPNDGPHSNANRQSSFITAQHNPAYNNVPHQTHPETHSSGLKPQLPPAPPIPSNMTSQSQTRLPDQQQQRDFSSCHPPGTTKGPVAAPACPYESPRLPSHRINSPSFNNYSPIHRLVVTGGNHLLNRGPNPCPHGNQQQLQPTTSTESSHFTSVLPRDGNNPFTSSSQGFSHNNNNPGTFTPVINRSVHPISSSSPLINHHHLQSISSPSPHPHPSPSCFQPGPHSFASPSPILRNPRYQYITSSNQNSPLLNMPKRINSESQSRNLEQQHYPYHNHGGALQPPPPNPNGPPPFSTFSPQPPPRQCITNGNNNPFTAASPNLNHKPYPVNGRNRTGSLGVEFENGNSFNPTGSQTCTTGANMPPSAVSSSNANRTNILSRSQSYQTHQVHYYASPVVPPPQPPPRMNLPPNHIPSTFSSNAEPPLLMKTHLHNQNIRLNNFLQNKQRYRHDCPRMTPARAFPNSESFQERIYETVDSQEEDDDASDNEERYENKGYNGQGAYPVQNMYLTQENKAYRDYTPDGRNIRYSEEASTHFQYTHGKSSNNASGSSQQQSSKLRSSKSKPSSLSMQPGSQPRPPVPMALFGPNTFLSETETRLLEADREADRKYKRLINEAEALLREISAVKSQQPWAHPEQESLRMEDCPQSDPLRRKAYDCWALRRLQQELAGCCASPPVLHRSRMNLQSPSTPTGAGHPYLSPNLSLTQHNNPLAIGVHNLTNMNDNNRNNAHF